MAFTKESPWLDFRKWWLQKEGEEKANDFTKWYEHHPLISPAMNVINSAIVVIDIKSMLYTYTSPNFSEFTGWRKEDYEKTGVQYAFNQIPEEDQPGVTLFSELINTYFQKLPENQKGCHRAYWDFRLLHGAGGYFKVLQQDCALKYDDAGRIEELLVFVSKIDNVISSDSQHLRITNGEENFFYKYNHKSKTNILLPLLSVREMEVARLIAKSLTLKQIASKLNISFNTVKVHSANMMEKLQVTDSLEMVNLLRVWAFI